MACISLGGTAYDVQVQDDLSFGTYWHALLLEHKIGVERGELPREAIQEVHEHFVEHTEM